VVRRDGTIYFTDPYWKFPPGAVQELDFQGVFRVTPKGKLSLEAKDFGLPNGIGLSPDEKTLYIGDSRRRKIYAFAVAADGSLSSQQQLADLQCAEKGAVDGMKLDDKGNIYTTGPDGIWVISAAGQHLGTIEAPEIPANCAWGDADYRTLYLTAPKSVYRVHTLVRGKATYALKPVAAKK
jgi:gluconolactonase